MVVLIVLFLVTQFGAGLVMSARVEGAQRALMFVFPLLIAPFIITQPAGLAIYWIATNVWTLGQQYVVQRLIPAPEKPTEEEARKAKAPPPPPRKKKRRR
jgi:YidC/Oxa1 family membrane protein insertase